MPPWILAALVLPASMFTGLQGLYVDYNYYNSKGADPLLQQVGIQPHEGLGFGIDLNLARGLYWDSEVTAMTDTSQYRTVEWNFRLYVEPVKNFELGYHHDSRHLMDIGSPYHFPVADSVEVRWKIQTNPEARKSWF